VLRHAAPAGASAERSWKASLEGARVSAALSPWIAAPSVEPSHFAARGLHPPASPLHGAAPLFILHCSLTL
jgi:hypothetical protein